MSYIKKKIKQKTEQLSSNTNQGRIPELLLAIALGIILQI